MEPVPSSPGNSPASGQNRRKSPRFETLGRVLGHLIDADLPVRVREIGFGGFSIETIEPIPVDIVVGEIILEKAVPMPQQYIYRKIIDELFNVEVGSN